MRRTSKTLKTIGIFAVIAGVLIAYKGMSGTAVIESAYTFNQFIGSFPLVVQQVAFGLIIMIVGSFILAKSSQEKRI